MAKQVGLVKYSGTMGGVRHFKIKGLDGDFAGLAGGPTSEQIYNDSAFARTRENMSEFGGCASAAKSLRVSLSQILKQFSDSRLTGRLTAIMKQINLEDQSEARGQRVIEISTQRHYLTGLNFNSNLSLSSIFNAPYTLTDDGSRTMSKLDVPSFNPSSLITAPAGATHFRLVNAISIVSDFIYNTTTGKYEPVAATINELSDIKYSDYINLNAVTPPILVPTSLNNVPEMRGDVSLLNCIGIEFYQLVGTNYYLFNSGNALRIDRII